QLSVQKCWFQYKRFHSRQSRKSIDSLSYRVSSLFRGSWVTCVNPTDKIRDRTEDNFADFISG
ncbi:MAG: hypothetical protein RLP02_03820, partial [Coleofasciculus sp. C2-GNP5-27]